MALKKIMVAFALLICLPYCCGASAEYTAVKMANADITARKITVNGSIENAVDGQLVWLSVTKPGKDKESITTENVREVVEYAEASVINDGSFDFTFYLPENATSGRYYVYVDTEKNGGFKDSFIYSDGEYIMLLLDGFKNPEGATPTEKTESIRSMLENPDIYEALGLDYTYVDSAVINAAAPILLEGFGNSLTDFNSVFYCVALSQMLKSDAENAVKDAALTVLAQKSGIAQMKAYSLSEGCSYREDMLSILKNNTKTAPDDLYDAVMTASFRAELSHTLRWNQVKALLEKYNEVLNINFTAYDALSDKASAAELFVKSDIKELKDIVQCFADSVKAASASEVKPSHTSSGGGGGGGGTKTYKTDYTAPVTDTQTKSFPDVAQTHWAYNDITELYKKGFVSGDENGRFNPEKSISRAEFVKLVITAFKPKAVKDALRYSDISENAWYYEYVSAASAAGIVNGKTEKDFCPQELILREEIAAVMCRVLTSAGKEIAPQQEISFADSAMVSDYAADSVAYLTQKGVISGFPDNTFAPKSTATRAQTAKMVSALLALCGKEGDL